MSSSYVEFGDGVIVEVGGVGEKRIEMHSGNVSQVETTMDVVASMMTKVLRPIGQSFQGLKETLDVPVEVESAEIELGLSFSAEGNLFVAKSSAEGSLTVKVVFKPIAKKSRDK